MLVAHVWDDPIHRDAIHYQFDKWSIAYELGNRRQAGRRKRELKRLCAEAEVRRQVREWQADRLRLVLPVEGVA
jgi:hypothetical protein